MNDKIEINLSDLFFITRQVLCPSCQKSCLKIQSKPVDDPLLDKPLFYDYVLKCSNCDNVVDYKGSHFRYKKLDPLIKQGIISQPQSKQKLYTKDESESTSCTSNPTSTTVSTCSTPTPVHIKEEPQEIEEPENNDEPMSQPPAVMDQKSPNKNQKSPTKIPSIEDFTVRLDCDRVPEQNKQGSLNHDGTLSIPNDSDRVNKETSVLEKVECVLSDNSNLNNNNIIKKRPVEEKGCDQTAKKCKLGACTPNCEIAYKLLLDECTNNFEGFTEEDITPFLRKKSKILKEKLNSLMGTYDEDDGGINLEEEEYFVENIIGYRLLDGKTEYLIKWKDYPIWESSWEPEENLFCTDLLNEFKKNVPLDGKSARESLVLNKESFKELIKKTATKFQIKYRNLECAVQGCQSKGGSKPVLCGNVLFHPFPLENQRLLYDWVMATGRTNFRPYKIDVICSRHFIIHDYLFNVEQDIIVLRPEAKPVRLFKASMTYDQWELRNGYEARSSCSVTGCKSNKNDNLLQNVLFHRYPHVLNPTYIAWIRATNKPGFIPNKFSTMCSLHFSIGDYAVINGLPSLKSTAIPRNLPTSESTNSTQKEIINHTPISSAALQADGEGQEELQVANEQPANMLMEPECQLECGDEILNFNSAASSEEGIDDADFLNDSDEDKEFHGFSGQPTSVNKYTGEVKKKPVFKLKSGNWRTPINERNRIFNQAPQKSSKPPPKILPKSTCAPMVQLPMSDKFILGNSQRPEHTNLNPNSIHQQLPPGFIPMPTSMALPQNSPSSGNQTAVKILVNTNLPRSEPTKHTPMMIPANGGFLIPKGPVVPGQQPQYYFIPQGQQGNFPYALPSNMLQIINTNSPQHGNNDTSTDNITPNGNSWHKPHNTSADESPNCVQVNDSSSDSDIELSDGPNGTSDGMNKSTKSPIKRSPAQIGKISIRSQAALMQSPNESVKDVPSDMKALKLFKCRNCNFKTPEALQIVAHLIRQHRSQHQKKGQFKCYLCNFNFPKKHLLIKHLDTEHHPDDIIVIFCPSCSVITEKKTQMLNHLRQKHPADKLFWCSKCNFVGSGKEILHHQARKHMNDSKLYFPNKKFSKVILLPNEVNSSDSEDEIEILPTSKNMQSRANPTQNGSDCDNVVLLSDDESSKDDENSKDDEKQCNQESNPGCPNESNNLNGKESEDESVSQPNQLNDFLNSQIKSAMSANLDWI